VHARAARIAFAARAFYPACHMPAWTLDLADEAATARLGETLAMMLRPGDVVALSGELGAGKSTLARALVRAFANAPALDVPSPTFTLAQSYGGEGFRFPLVHADLYRLEAAAEIDELGLDEALDEGAVVVEWPERAGGRLPAARIGVRLDFAGAGRRAALGSPDPDVEKRLARAARLRGFLDRTPFAAARRLFLQGDASPRAYERLLRDDGARAILLDAAARPTPEPRRAYMAVTHLAPNEDVRPILAIGAELARAGASVPAVIAADVAAAALVLEDLGAAYVAEAGAPVAERYAVAADLLAHLHARDWPEVMEGGGACWGPPRYSRRAMEVEAGLFVERFLPAATGRPVAPETAAAFTAAWRAPLDYIDAAPRTLTIFDFHSPNLHWLPERAGLARIGVIDFQDARLGPPAYDLVSLTQDARVTVPAELERELYDRYVAARRGAPGFDEGALAATYAACGAQRATRILGVFARLAHEDGKPGYLKHMPRVSDYLERCLEHPLLAELRAWYEAHAPAALRAAFADRGADR
jgi:tRNA threonylcarbamoyl adenosine modification protein YjeE